MESEMGIQISKKKCPFCRQSAFVSNVEVEPELPEDRIQVQCDRCGEFHLLTKEAQVDKESISLESIKKIPLDLERIARTNRYSQSESRPSNRLFYLDAMFFAMKDK